jgi:hypothetical protein
MTQSNTGASSLYEQSSKGYCLGLGFSVWCIRSKHCEYLCRPAHPCALREGQTRRKAVRSKGGGAMSVVAGVAKAVAGTKVLTGRRPAGRTSPRTKRALVVAVALLALLALAAMISASQAPSAEHSSTGSTDYQPEAVAAPVTEPAAPQMSEREALDAYEKLPLSFVPNEGQTEEAVRYYAQGAGYGFFFTKKGARLSFAEGKGRGGRALGLEFLGADPHATLTAQQRLAGKVNYLGPVVI